MVHRSLLILILCLIAGCSYTHSVIVGLKHYPPKPDSYDTSILSPDDVHAAHLTVIGKLFASKEVIISEENAIPGVIEMMKEKSKRLGADAMINVIIIRDVDSFTGSSVISGKADAVVMELPKGNVEKEVPTSRTTEGVPVVRDLSRTERTVPSKTQDCYHEEHEVRKGEAIPFPASVSHSLGFA
jgi:hypothetical protein